MAKTSRLSLDTVPYVILFVKEMARSLKFYRDTLGIPVRFESSEWTELETKGVTIALHGCHEPVPAMPKASAQVVFGAADVRAAHAALRQRKAKVGDLHVVHEAGKDVGVAADLRDPDGNSLSIYGMVPAKEWTAPTAAAPARKKASKAKATKTARRA